MATLSHSGSGRLYSWWWDSHNSPKNSKWLQENLKDMDAKVKAMIKLIEEDADSFARRAEMYYKKRPELMKLVEEIYRAYRALAERYDHATVELRQAHRTMVEAFPNQVPYDLIDDSPSETSVSGPEEPHSPELQHSICSLSELNDSSTSTDGSGYGLSKRGLRQLDEDAFSQLSSQNQNLKLRVETSETEIQNIKEMLTKMEAEKEAIFAKYQKALEKLSDLERELDIAQKGAAGLDHRASKAEIEMKILKEALSGIESERDASFLRYNQSLERISTLENLLSLSQEQAKALDMIADKAKNETQYLRSQLLSLKSEKEDNLRQYKLSLEKISLMEAKISAAEENAGVLNEHIVRAECEVNALKETINELNKEKETASLRYQECLDTMAKMESEIAHFQNNAKQLNGKLLAVAKKLDSAEVKCSQLEESNQTLRLEADSLIRKITMKDRELARRHDDLKKFQLQIQDEQSRFTQVETTLHALQKLHSQSQEEQRALSIELKNGLQMLKELGSRKLSVEEELQKVKEENRSLNESNLSSSISAKNLEDEIFNLKETKDKLEEEVFRKAEYSNTLEQEIHRLREEIKAINGRYQTIMMQVESVKELQNENAKLRDTCEIERTKGDILHEKLNSMDKISKDNAVLEKSLAEMNGELEKLREKAKDFQESCHFLQGEKTTLVAEKATLLLQLQIITENMQKLIEKNNSIENSLSGANNELEGLRGHSKSLEEFCQLLKSEKSTILNERDALVSQLESVELRLGNLEMRFSNLEEKYTSLENENETTLNQVEELRSSIVSQKEEHASYRTLNESKVSGLETHIHILQEKSRLGKREFEEELEKAVNAQVEIFILQKFVEDLEGKNYLMFIECQKLNETTRLSNKLISELERENLEQQVEIEFLVDEIENLRGGIHRVFKALQIDLDNGHKHKTEREKLPLLNILDKVEELKTCFLINKDEMQQLQVENSVLLTLLGQQQFEGQELQVEKIFLENKFEILKEEFATNEKDKQDLLEMKKQLMFEITEKEQHEKFLAGGIQIQNLELENLKLDYLALQEENSEMLKEKRSELHKFSRLKEANHVLEEAHRIISEEAVALSIFALVCESFAADKAVEMKALNEDRSWHRVANSELKEDIEKRAEILLAKETEILELNKSVRKLMEELHEVKNSNDVLTHEIVTGNNFVRQKVEELSRTEHELKDVEELNAKLYNEAEELRMECKGSTLLRENLEIENLELCMNAHRLNDEITWLNEMNENLKSEIGVLNKEIEECRIREENLSAELQEKRDGVELWDVEAASFYFDLQISSVREVFLENKLHEVTQVCEKLGGESAAKDVEIRSLRESIMFMESEMGGLKAKFSAYLPDSTSPKENVEVHEHCVLPQLKHLPGGIQEEMDDENTVLCNRMGARTKEFEEIEEKERETITNQGTFDTKVEVRGTMKQIKEFISEESSDHEITKNERKIDQILNPGAKRSENGTLMKDIPLDQVSDFLLNRKSKTENRDSNDQMLQLWETVEKNIGQHETANEMQKLAIIPLETDQNILEEKKYSDTSSELQIEKELGVDMLERSSSIRERSQGGKKRRILQRLASDAQKLTNIQSAVHDLKKRLEKKNWSKKESSIEYEKVCKQVKEVEETITQLVTVNDQLTKNIEHVPASLAGKTASELESENVSRNSVMERARKGSEKIGRLHFEVQNIQLILMKLEEEKKRKWKTRFSKNKTDIILRDFIYSSRKNSEKQQQKKKNKNKNCFCGCNRESTDEDGETNDL